MGTGDAVISYVRRPVILRVGRTSALRQTRRDRIHRHGSGQFAPRGVYVDVERTDVRRSRDAVARSEPC